MKEWIHPSGVAVIEVNTVVVGTGAAGYNAADCLYDEGQTDLCIITENVQCGTSRNTGSDKQTYYKLTLSGDDPDSVRGMAQTLFDGQCMDGDTALCEAALSAECFLRLARLGVPFPRNRYGEYVGYKTDHDPRRRATSAGPYTSKMMTECLQRSVEKKKIPVLSGMQVIRILSDGKKTAGLLCLKRDLCAQGKVQFTAVCSRNVVWATGGPAGMYADSVYPWGQYGATGTALAAGARGQNLTEWQYGLASVSPRWNVSGTYMQVLPRFISQNPDGSDPKEFLLDFYQDKMQMLNSVFLKGYQWPFDVRKASDGSSVIDLLVFQEKQKGRRVFLDFRENPGMEEIDFELLSEEAKTYLQQAGACFGTPIQRLAHMNMPAIEFYRDKGVDLEKEPLEISLCAQHNNGGVAVDAWWQTCVQGLFVVGEAAGTHGVYRPGGSALNAGQVGSLRAAQYISVHGREEPDHDLWERLFVPALSWAEAVCRSAVERTEGPCVRTVWDQTVEDMSRNAAAIRDRKVLQELAERIATRRQEFAMLRVGGTGDMPKLFRLWDVLLCQQSYVYAMLDYLDQGGKSRGSSLYRDETGDQCCACLSSDFRYSVDDVSRKDWIQQTCWEENRCVFQWRKVRPLPQEDDFFENVWREFRKNKNVM